MTDKLGVVILAAGKGTRLKVNTPKPLLSIAGRPLLGHVLKALNKFQSALNREVIVSVIVGHEAGEVRKFCEEQQLFTVHEYIEQVPQKGTGHALQIYCQQSKYFSHTSNILVLCADTPLITAEMLLKLHSNLKSASAIAATFCLEDPTGYGRIARSEKGEEGFSIVEEKDAQDEEKRIQEVNSGIYVINSKYLQSFIFKINNQNNSSEFYLTDLFKKDRNVIAFVFNNPRVFEGINDLYQATRAEDFLIGEKKKNLAKNGVRFVNIDSIYIEDQVDVAIGAEIGAGVQLLGDTKIGEGVKIENGCVIKNSIIENNTTILAYSYVEDSKIASRCTIGPFARLRPGTELDEHVKVGNFVELKKSSLAKGAKVSHLSYVGDAEIGENTNIGCGFITCNYDGTSKHKTIIGRESFIGSDCQMIAPITIGDHVYIGSGSTINQDVESEAFAIARARQVTKPQMAKRFSKKK